ncbi:MAG TPA: ATP-dependent helicase [Spirochaetales bacterium]|nr:ATP-dependent helicase [Spirochaetales bacterium]
MVEQRLKRGELAAIVATSSLELGIDIGALDQVILVQTPFSISSGVQRIGRAGHSVGEVSRGSLYPTHGRDFLEAAIMARSIVEQDIEEAKPVTAPLDVLAQVIISMTGVEEWDVDELYNFLKCCYAYQKLPRKHFDLVIEMLAGRYSESRIRELKARVYLDRLDNRIQAKSGALSLIYHSGGTIPDRGYFNLRLQGSKAKIGELDEEFVWERRTGDSFTLAAQSWKITNITHQDVEVVPGRGQVNYLPFWKAEKENRDFHFSEKITLFLEEWNSRLDSPEFDLALKEIYLMDRAAISELKSFLLRQREKTGTDLPHRHHLLIEYGDIALENSGNRRVIAHTQWGGRVNHPLALALSGAWEEKFSCHLEVVAGNDSIMFLLPADFDILQLFDLVKPDNLERLLRKKLESSGFFGAHFRQNAGRALLLPRSGFQKRMPLWHTRLRSKKLFESVLGYENFPILLETWRTCLQDEFDLENLKQLLQELQSGKIKCTVVKASVFSPFAANLVWQQQDKHIYEGDSAFTGSISRLSDDLLKEVALSAHLRPHLDPRLVKEFKQKLQRTAPGYSPPTPIELLDWVKERLLIPESEWQELLEAVERDHQLDPKEMLETISSKLLKITLPGASVSSITAVELLPRVLSALQLNSKEAVLEPLLPATATDLNSFISQLKISWYNDEEAKEQLRSLTAEWLRFYGPLQATYVGEVFGFGAPVLQDITNILAESSIIVIDRFTLKSRTLELCDVENLETLLRLTRVKARPDFEAVEFKDLPLFLAMINGLTCKGESRYTLENILELLFGYPAPAQLWERDIFTARLKTYYSSHLDNLLQQSELQWFGCGRQRIGFCFASDMDLFNDNGADNEQWIDVESLFAHRRGGFSFWDILDSSGQSSEQLTAVLWEKVWQGKISNDSFAVLRRGLENKFKIENAPGNKGRIRGRTGGRYSFNRWKASRPFSGNWYSSRPEEYPLDALEREEVIKERVRQLFRRYGIIFKQILENELPFLRWSKVFRALRIMELSGEILSGHFFKGLPGLQFMTHPAFNRLKDDLPRDAIYWLSAVDPASTCGLKLDNLPGNLPSRLPSTHLVYHGNNLVVVSRRGGRILRIFVSPESPHLTEYLQFFKTLITRDYKPQKYIRVESINDLEVNFSPYSDELCRFGFVKDYKTLTLYS